ncbi:winged helix-turn-helix transcriptional regulator [Hymenobacter busanensis]|uniref:Winged helix-turn-helix transcriptional regulator n=1 Tax=Hymenobacter busanensis TaxID=2607656 RepID=A0A7L4ZZW6_9BACT|nr:metalloregulator ArsR/SmtB family transcription factor [Hymenobacter busanensis]KAA9325315.1 winged helix-turn-helix transcriptional regulator [Hymenobacter busanensis]QHJ07692.1 metalloregulator ArsR/SmtB family transcription factor [Hymenobacter busanensis]
MDAALVTKTTNALADKYRLGIVLALSQREPLAFAEVQQLTGLSQPCTSHHLKVLADSGLVETQKQGRCVLVRLNREALRGLSAFLGELG